MPKKYEGSLFGSRAAPNQDSSKVDAHLDPQLARAFMDSLMEKYKTGCLNVKQLQEVVNVGESNVYNLMSKSILAYKKIGNRKVVPIPVVVDYLINSAPDDI